VQTPRAYDSCHFEHERALLIDELIKGLTETEWKEAAN
jgi:hypothetical protein